MSVSGLYHLIESATVGDSVDLKLICQTLDVHIKIDNNLQDLCKIGADKNKKIIIWLNPKLDKKTKFTLVAIALAEYIIHPEKVTSHGVLYDMFFLRELNANKATKLIMLATRLVVPEHIIEKISNSLEVQFSNDSQTDNFDTNAYIAMANYLPEFLRCVIKESSSMFLIDNLSIKHY